jgi:hypothetical protein
MLRLVLCVAVLATAGLAVAGVAAAGQRVSVTVQPATPGPTTPVTVSFVAKHDDALCSEPTSVGRFRFRVL